MNDVFTSILNGKTYSLYTYYLDKVVALYFTRFNP